MFGSRTVLEHALRGVVGLTAIIMAIVLGRETGAVALIASVALAGIALVAFRGCPVCWTIGMVETVRERLIATGTKA